MSLDESPPDAVPAPAPLTPAAAPPPLLEPSAAPPLMPPLCADLRSAVVCQAPTAASGPSEVLSPPVSAAPGRDDTALPPVEPGSAAPGSTGIKLPPPLPELTDLPPLLPTARRVATTVWLFLALSLTLPVAGIMLGGETGVILMASMEALPAAALCIFAYLGEERPWARVLAWVCAVCLLGLLGFVSVFITVGMEVPALLEAPDTLKHTDVLQVLSAVALTSFVGLVGVGVSALLLLPGMRSWAAARLRQNGLTQRQQLGLVFVCAATWLFLLPLLTGHGPPLLELDLLDTESRDVAEEYRSMLYGLCWLVVAAFFAVGLGVTRGLGEACQRLGLIRPRRREILVGVLAVPLLLGLAFSWDFIVGHVWPALGWPVTDEVKIEELFGVFMTPTGAVVIAITAGLGEELAIRGILQPRLGILLPNLFFAAMHAWQYHWDGVIVVFLLGLCFSFLRRRFNTTTSAITHGLYDLVLFLIP